MNSKPTVNSKEYWDNRFASGDWETKGGNKQTRYFYELLYTLLPKHLRIQFNDANTQYTIADIGCAEGDGTKLLAEKFFNSKVSGVDISEAAIKKAKILYPDIDFFSTTNKQYDIVISSNVLEHFKNPFEHLRELFTYAKKYVVILVPFEEYERVSEHFYTFLYKDFNLKFEDFNLIYTHVIDANKDIWNGKQHLLVYQKNANLSHISLDTFGIKALITREEQKMQKLQSAKEQEIQKLEKEQAQELQKLKNEKEKELQKFKNERKKELQKFKNERKKELQKFKNERDMYYSWSLEKERNIQEQTNALNSIYTSTFWRVASKYYTLRDNTPIVKQTFQLLKSLKHKGLKKTVKKIISKINKTSSNPVSNTQHKNKLKKILQEHKNKTIVILPPLVDWNIPLFQRPQHLARNIAKQNILYFFATPNGSYDSIDGFKVVSKGCYITNCFDLVDNIEGQKKYYDLSSTDNGTDWSFVKDRLDRGDGIIYQYIDEISEEISGHEIPKSLFEKHFNILKDERCIVIPSATKLEEDVKEHRTKNYKLVTNGVEIEHFSQTIEKEHYPTLIQNLLKKDKPIIGYFGAFANWFDYELVIELATKRPDIEILLLGVDYDGSIKRYHLEKYENITVAGPIDYKELPKYAACFDVSTIPFMINDITESTSPIKLFEYMAMKRPIVTTNMPECRKYDSVLIGKTHEEYISKIEEALTLREDENYLKLLEKEALKNSWESKARDIVEMLDD